MCCLLRLCLGDKGCSEIGWGSSRSKSGSREEMGYGGGTDPLGMFLLFFLRELLMSWPPHLSGVFKRLVRLGSFQPCWRQANVTPIPKGPPYSSIANYQPISITSVLSKVFERLVSVRFGRFMERSGALPTTQFVYRKGPRYL